MYALQGCEYDTIHAPHCVSQKTVNADMAKARFIDVEPKVVRRIEEICRRSRAMGSCVRQIGVAIAIAAAGATRKL
jgi:hypothetical protein